MHLGFSFRQCHVDSPPPPQWSDTSPLSSSILCRGWIVFCVSSERFCSSKIESTLCFLTRPAQNQAICCSPALCHTGKEPVFVLGCIHWRIGGGGGGDEGSGFREASNFTKFSQIEGQFNVKHLLNTIKHFSINTSSIKKCCFQFGSHNNTSSWRNITACRYDQQSY